MGKEKRKQIKLNTKLRKKSKRLNSEEMKFPHSLTFQIASTSVPFMNLSNKKAYSVSDLKTLYISILFDTKELALQKYISAKKK